jgi:hypothetical protein
MRAWRSTRSAGSAAQAPPIHSTHTKTRTAHNVLPQRNVAP